MATSKIQIHDTTYTLILDGEGFAYAEQEVEYLFADIQPTGGGMVLSPRNQMNGTTGQKLWARSVGFTSVDVFVNQEV
ncbi:MAG TPA: hypothetical protein CFH81_02125 [Sulfurovum sp. UBA12169]|nr:MAG TPA: hypothetical protein CFH81_02125 [Sulfurovum sp. UBA12169]